jgi:hypothetical protein
MKIQVLVVFDNDFRSYREAIAIAIQAQRPNAEVTIAEPRKFDAEARRISPDLVIYGGPDAGDLGPALAWIRLSNDAARPATVCLNGRLSEAANPTMDDLLFLFDKVEKLASSRLA